MYADFFLLHLYRFNIPAEMFHVIHYEISDSL